MTESLEHPQPFPSVGETLKKLGIWLERGKSQHFLRDQRVCMAIAELAQLGPNDLAIEVGTGLGNLTVEMAARAGRVLTVEMDTAFEEWHRALAIGWPRATFLQGDFLAQNLEALVATHRLDGRVCGMGNLPYQITSEILFRFVDSPVQFDALVFMVQKEVAERVAAGAACRAAGALTYKIALRYKAEIAMRIPPGAFLPPPRVDSAVLVLKPLETPLVTDLARRARIYSMLDHLFLYRRKTLSNCLLQGGMAGDREDGDARLAKAGIDAKRRPETLTLAEVLALEAALDVIPPTRVGKQQRSTAPQ